MFFIHVRIVTLVDSEEGEGGRVPWVFYSPTLNIRKRKKGKTEKKRKKEISRCLIIMIMVEEYQMFSGAD